MALHARRSLCDAVLDALNAIPGIGGRVYEEGVKIRERDGVPFAELMLGEERVSPDTLGIRKRELPITVLLAALTRQDVDEMAAIVEAALDVLPASGVAMMVTLDGTVPEVVPAPRGGVSRTYFGASLKYTFVYRTRVGAPRAAV